MQSWDQRVTLLKSKVNAEIGWVDFQAAALAAARQISVIEEKRLQLDIFVSGINDVSFGIIAANCRSILGLRRNYHNGILVILGK